MSFYLINDCFFKAYLEIQSLDKDRTFFIL